MDDLDKLLKFDPLDTAEKITGVSTADAELQGFENPAMAVGFVLMQENAAAKEEWLTELDDTSFHNKLERYQRIIEKFGFEQVLADNFTSKWDNHENYFIYAHRKGLLLSFDTFNQTSVNGGKVYYQWRPSVPLDETHGCRSSGCFENYDTDPVWIGDHDCREALIHNLNKLNNRGEFVSPWIKRPFLWLLHHGDTEAENYDYKEINETRIERLPQWVKDFIGPPSRKA